MMSSHRNLQLCHRNLYQAFPELVKAQVLVAKLEDLPHIEDNFLPLELFKALPTRA